MVKPWMLGLSVLALAGCTTSTHHEHPGAQPEMGPGSLEAPAAVSVADPCAAGPAGCEQLGTVDVDGDGVADRVGVATQWLTPEQHEIGAVLTTVRVATATGIRQREVNGTLIFGDQSGPRDLLIGAYPISRTQGADLVLHTARGQGGPDEFVVLGWSGNDLAPVPQPAIAESYPGDPGVWQLSESHGRQHWVSCSSGGSISVTSEAAGESTGGTLPGGGIIETDHWTFTNGQWSPAGSENAASDDFSFHIDAHKDAFKCEDQLQR